MTKAGHGVVATPRSPMQEGRLLHSDLRAQAPLYLFPREKVKGLCVLCIAVWGFRPAPLLSSWRGGLWGSERSDPQGGLVKAAHTRRDPARFHMGVPPVFAAGTASKNSKNEEELP